MRRPDRKLERAMSALDDLSESPWLDQGSDLARSITDAWYELDQAIQGLSGGQDQ